MENITIGFGEKIENITIRFKNNNKILTVTKIKEEDKNNHFYYDYELNLIQENLFKHLEEEYEYGNMINDKIIEDVIYSKDYLKFYYLDKNEDMNTIVEILNVFNLSDKTSQTIFNYDTQEIEKKEIDNIPNLTITDIKSIYFN